MLDGRVPVLPMGVVWCACCAGKLTAADYAQAKLPHKLAGSHDRERGGLFLLVHFFVFVCVCVVKQDTPILHSPPPPMCISGTHTVGGKGESPLELERRLLDERARKIRAKVCALHGWLSGCHQCLEGKSQSSQTQQPILVVLCSCSAFKVQRAARHCSGFEEAQQHPHCCPGWSRWLPLVSFCILTPPPAGGLHQRRQDVADAVGWLCCCSRSPNMSLLNPIRTPTEP